MENLSPSRIQPLLTGDDNGAGQPAPEKPVKPLAKAKAAAALPPVDAAPDEKDHLLDELA
jgi:hypothetical protein